MTTKKIIMIMIDGFGIPPSGWYNSVYSEACSSEFIDFLQQYSIPLDACLEVEGIPQSATGQITIYTGINAAKLKGAHIPGFPAKTLRKIISENNIFSKLIEFGKKPVFANAYISHSLEEILKTKFASVTTIMSNAALGKVLNRQDLLKGEAIYHDITRFTISEKYNIPKIKPETAAVQLLNIAEKYDFVLFEYFLTDKLGHSRNKFLLHKILSELDQFINTIRYNLYKDTVLMICSDHGNCEDMSTKSHTKNKVPFTIFGSTDGETINYKDISDIYHAIINIYH